MSGRRHRGQGRAHLRRAGELVVRPAVLGRAASRHHRARGGRHAQRPHPVARFEARAVIPRVAPRKHEAGVRG
eukprot:4516805-Pyramimonas_sp.AAC.1